MILGFFEFYIVRSSVYKVQIDLLIEPLGIGLFGSIFLPEVPLTLF